MKKCYLRTPDGLEEVEFMGVFQKSQVIPPSIMAGGGNGGTVAGPVAVIIFRDTMQEVELMRLSFKDEPQPFKGLFDEVSKQTSEEMIEKMREHMQEITDAGGWVFEHFDGTVTYGTKEEVLALRNQANVIQRRVIK